MIRAAFVAVMAALVLATGARAAEVIDDDARFPEGPVWHDGTLYYVEYAGDTLRAWDGEESRVVWQQAGCGPSAAAVLPDGGFLITCYDANTLVRVADGETAETWSSDAGGRDLIGPNDISVAADGSAYVTLSGPWATAPIVGRVVRLAPDGRLTGVADDLHYANGIAVGPDGERLYVAESEAYRIVSFAIGADGALSDRRLFVRLADLADGRSGHYPDGMKFGPDGNLWIGQFSHGQILVATPEGEPADRIDLPSPAVPNLTFGPDGTLYVMAVDQVDAAPYRGKVYRVARP